MEVPASCGEVPARHWSKIRPEITCIKGVTGTFHFNSVTFPKMARLSAIRNLDPWFLPQRGEYVRDCSASPAMWGTTKDTQFFLIPLRVLECVAWLGSGKQLGKQQPWIPPLPKRDMGTLQRDMAPTNCAADSIMSHCETHWWIPPISLKAHTTLCKLTHTSPHSGQLPEHIP